MQNCYTRWAGYSARDQGSWSVAEIEMKSVIWGSLCWWSCCLRLYCEYWCTVITWLLFLCHSGFSLNIQWGCKTFPPAWLHWLAETPTKSSTTSHRLLCSFLTLFFNWLVRLRPILAFIYEIDCYIYINYIYIYIYRGVQILGLRSPWRLNFVRLRLMVVLLGTSCHVTLLAPGISTWLIDFWKICGPQVLIKVPVPCQGIYEKWTVKKKKELACSFWRYCYVHIPFHRHSFIAPSWRHKVVPF